MYKERTFLQVYPYRVHGNVCLTQLNVNNLYIYIGPNDSKF